MPRTGQGRRPKRQKRVKAKGQTSIDGAAEALERVEQIVQEQLLGLDDLDSNPGLASPPRVWIEPGVASGPDDDGCAMTVHRPAQHAAQASRMIGV